MVKDVHSFFVTKVAKDDPKKVIDPGEAAAAGLAIAAGPLAQQIIPPVASYALSGLGPEQVPWQGTQVSGLSKVEPFLTAQTEADLKKFIGPKTQTRRLLNLFDVRTKPMPEGFSPRSIEALAKSYPLIDKMIDRYDLAKKGVKLEFTEAPLASLTGPKWIPHTKTVRMPVVNEELILHELGHAAHETRVGSKAFGAIRNFAARAGTLSVPMAFLAGNEIQKMLPGTVDDKIIDFIQKNAPAVMAASYAASELYPEVQATTRAVHHVYKTKGAAAARKTLKALMPSMISHVVPIIPVLVGVSLAKKWYFKEKAKEEKTAGVLKNIGQGFWETIGPLAAETANIAGQVGRQTSELLRKPPEKVMKTLWRSGMDTVKSPEFVSGAVTAGIPAATFAYVYHNTPHGKAYRRALDKHESQFGSVARAEVDLRRVKEEARDDSATWPAIVGIGAALSGGFLAKMWSDIAHVL
jgi:hypothetical protein